jgi:UDP-N-acetyl-2-amino-2-deoxyglucuronate dehydrogenase
MGMRVIHPRTFAATHNHRSATGHLGAGLHAQSASGSVGMSLLPSIRPMKKNFALIGAAGFVAPRHLEAIRATGNNLVAATDLHDSVGILDRFFPDTRFFTEFERFDRHLEKLRRKGPGEAVDFVSICSPNYLHDAHCRLALRIGADAICEKPLVINPWNIDQLTELEEEYGRRVWTILQLRTHPKLIELKQRLDAQKDRKRVNVELSYVTRRGSWYHYSWKGQPERSGGLAMNIGIHFFDMLLWLFGDMHETETHLHQNDRMSGRLELEWASVKWFLSVNRDDLPAASVAAGKPAFRALTMDGEDFEFSDVFGDLHTAVYQRTLEGNGFGLKDARPAIELVATIRNAPVRDNDADVHPMLKR